MNNGKDISINTISVFVKLNLSWRKIREWDCSPLRKLVSSAICSTFISKAHSPSKCLAKLNYPFGLILREKAGIPIPIKEISPKVLRKRNSLNRWSTPSSSKRSSKISPSIEPRTKRTSSSSDSHKTTVSQETYLNSNRNYKIIGISSIVSTSPMAFMCVLETSKNQFDFMLVLAITQLWSKEWSEEDFGGPLLTRYNRHILSGLNSKYQICSKTKEKMLLNIK